MTFLVQAQRELVGRNIRRARLSAGLSHDRLAAAVDTSRQHLIKLEKGQHLAGDKLLGRIAAATGHEIEWFAKDHDSSDDEDEESDPVDLATALLSTVRQLVRAEMQAVRS